MKTVVDLKTCSREQLRSHIEQVLEVASKTPVRIDLRHLNGNWKESRKIQWLDGDKWLEFFLAGYIFWTVYFCLSRVLPSHSNIVLFFSLVCFPLFVFAKTLHRDIALTRRLNLEAEKHNQSAIKNNIELLHGKHQLVVDAVPQSSYREQAALSYVFETNGNDLEQGLPMLQTIIFKIQILRMQKGNQNNENC